MTDENTTEIATPTDEENVSLSRAPRAGAIARRDFGGSSLAMSSASTDALVAKARADVEARWIMAMRMPRNLDDVRQYVIAECKVPSFAKAAVYAKPVGGGNVVEGLSIRFAEMAARQFGNLSVEHTTIFDSDDTRIARVTVTDFESNATWSKDISIRKTVERKQLKKGQKPLGERINSYGDRVFIVEATDDDVAIKEAALVSKASRTGILRLLPGNLQREAMELCKKVQRDAAAKDPDGERRAILDGFALLRVMPSDLEEYLGHPSTQITPVEIERLRSVFIAIREGEATWADTMADINEARAQAKGAEPRPLGVPATAPKPAPAPQAAEPTKDAVAPAPLPEKKKGAAALKETLKAQPVPTVPPTNQASKDYEATVAAAREREAARHKQPELVPDQDRADKGPCAGCGAPVVDNPGDLCGDCTAAKRDAE